MLIQFRETDVNLQLAIRAHDGTSFTPEKRGAGYVSGYMAHMKDLCEKFGRFETDENRAELAADLERYRVKYLDLMHRFLASHSNVMSAFITGPANFPTRRNEKRNRWADNHRNNWLEFQNKSLEKLRRTYDPKAIANAPIRSDDNDAASKLQKKIELAEERQAMMKAANKVVRNKKLTNEQRVEKLTELKLSKALIAEILTPDYMGRIGFASYQLTNNNANIRRMKERLVSLEKEAAKREIEVPEKEINGVMVVENTDIGRYQLVFPDKPPTEVRTLLKKNGFRWSPREGAWQRLLNDNSRQAGELVLSKL